MTEPERIVHRVPRPGGHEAVYIEREDGSTVREVRPIEVAVRIAKRRRARKAQEQED